MSRAGYGWAVKLDKEFFIGKAAMERISREYDMKVARIQLPGTKGTRPIRQNDGVLGEHGRIVGWVPSCAVIDEKQIALVYVDRGYVEENDAVGSTIRPEVRGKFGRVESRVLKRGSSWSRI